ncbi:cysteine desulfurase-like protein [soil metagenome]
MATAAAAKKRAPKKADPGPIPVSEIRKHFPALERKHNGHAVAYFDGPGGTQVPRQVVEAMADYLYHHNANTHWVYPTSEETDAALVEAREAAADLLNASADEIAFGANMTTLTFHLARGLGRKWGKGDEIVITELDHHANVAPWQALAKERGVTIKSVKLIPATGQLDYAHMEKLITKKTKLVAIGGASNAIGTINDIKRACKLAHAVGALAFVDAVHYAPHALVDVKAIDCDFLGCSAYKFYGPHIGILYARRSVFKKVDFPKLEPAPTEIPEVAETGTLNHEGIIGARAAIDFLASFGEGNSRRAKLKDAYHRLHESADGLVSRLWSGLAAIKGVKLYGPEPHLPRTPTVSFTVKGVTSTEVCRRLAKKGLFLSNGDFYAKTAVEKLGQAKDGIVRAGCACYASAEEVERLIAGVQEIAGGK